MFSASWQCHHVARPLSWPGLEKREVVLESWEKNAYIKRKPKWLFKQADEEGWQKKKKRKLGQSSVIKRIKARADSVAEAD